MHWNGRFCPWRQQPVISYSTSIVEWWAYQPTVYAECPYLRHTHSTLNYTPPCAPLKGGSCRLPPHHQLEMRSSPVLALHSHPLSSCTSEGHYCCYLWGLSFLGITTQNTTLHCLYVNAAYVGFAICFFFSLWLRAGVHLIEEKVYFSGDYAGTMCIFWHVAEEGTSVLLVLFLFAPLLPQQAHSPLLHYYPVWKSWFTVLSLT